MEHIKEVKEQHFSYFCNRECEYFPCHKGVAEEDFNCLFCYCPLYVLGDDCGGDYRYTKSGRKDCSNCSFPHRKENYRSVTGRYKEIEELMKEFTIRKTETCKKYPK